MEGDLITHFCFSKLLLLREFMALGDRGWIRASVSTSSCINIARDHELVMDQEASKCLPTHIGNFRPFPNLINI